MARLLPKIAVENIELKPERDVAKALVEKLPDDVLVIHSYPWLRRKSYDKGGSVRLQEGETDFVILWPNKGLLVIEVKGGEIEYDEDKMLWIRVHKNGNKDIIKDPFVQASKNLHALEKLISEKLYAGGKLPFVYGYLVCFPGCRYEGPTPAGTDPIIILSESDFDKFNFRLSKAILAWNPGNNRKSFPRDMLEKVERAILPKFNLLPILFKTIEAQEETLFLLTQRQLELLDFLNNRPRALIEGVAGSGKTMMARVQTERFAESGLKSLLICYNKNLADVLREELSDEYKDAIDVVHFHKLCHDWCKEAGIAFDPKDDGEFWHHEAANLFFDAIEIIDRHYDAIIVDEGQDFYSDWWEPIQYLLKVPESGHLYVFYDPVQNLYNHEGMTLPALGNPFSLPTNCRNTKSIAATCSKIIKYPINTRKEAPEGDKTEWYFEVGSDKSFALLSGWVRNWVMKEKIKCSQIAILSPVRQNNSSLSGINEIGGVTVLGQDKMKSWSDNKGVLFSTIRSFKGLEADIIVVIDVSIPKELTIFSPADFYVGCSRAKHILKILTPLSGNDISSYMPEVF